VLAHEHEESVARPGDAGGFAAEGVERRNRVLESILRDVFDDL
jgi:hypothetical protein